MEFDLQPQAVEDLDAILSYINALNPQAAVRLLDEFFSIFRSLPAFPNQGFRRPDLTSRDLRFKVVEHYLIAYAPQSRPVSIVAVVDGRRNPRVLAATLRSRA